MGQVQITHCIIPLMHIQSLVFFCTLYLQTLLSLCACRSNFSLYNKCHTHMSKSNVLPCMVIDPTRKYSKNSAMMWLEENLKPQKNELPYYANELPNKSSSY